MPAGRSERLSMRHSLAPAAPKPPPLAKWAKEVNDWQVAINGSDGREEEGREEEEEMVLPRGGGGIGHQFSLPRAPATKTAT